MIEDSASSSLRLANHTKRTLQTICLTFDKCSQIFILQSDASADFSNVHYTDCMLKRRRKKSQNSDMFCVQTSLLGAKTKRQPPTRPCRTAADWQ